MKIKIISIIVVIFIFSTAYAENNQEYNKIIENLRCLVCQNQSLSESDSNLAKDLRLKVKTMLESGKSEDDI
ncbi:cytochrome c-type biogenesis protein CcmH, partial [Gammaproteobacteria bacterium]|nr:cytochrome c-type biogenesis protein CcmH [Gammaproteobacteria bacterium]